MIEQAYNILFTVTLVVLALCVLALLIYIIRSRLTVDRIIGINLIGTIVSIIICVLTRTFNEGYLADIAIIYTMLSFLAVVVLTRIYLSVWKVRRVRERDRAAEENGGGRTDG